MSSIAPTIPTIEVKFSIGGLIDLVDKLRESGELSKPLFEATANRILSHWTFKKSPANKQKKEKADAKVAKKDTVLKPTEPKAVTEKAGSAEKLSGLKKLGSIVGEEVNLTSFKDYTSQENHLLRTTLEAKWADHISSATGETRGDKIKHVISEAGLSEDEARYSRAYFPKFSAVNDSKKKTSDQAQSPKND